MKEPTFTEKEKEIITKRFKAVPKRRIVITGMIALLLLGGSASAAVYFYLKSIRGNDYTLIVKDNTVGYWVGDKINLNNLEISKVDKTGKVTSVDKSKVTLSKDTLDKEGEDSIVITDTESKAKSGLKVNVLEEGRVTSDIYDEMYDVLNRSSKLFRYNSFKSKNKYTYAGGEDEETYIYRNGKEKHKSNNDEYLICHFDDRFYDVVTPTQGGEDKTLYYTANNERNLSYYDDSIKGFIIERLIADFSSLKFDETNKYYWGNKEIHFSSFSKNCKCQYKFNKQLMTTLICESDEDSNTINFEYNKETDDPFGKTVYKNFDSIDIGEEGTGLNRSITLSATLESEAVPNPNLATAQCYASDKSKSHLVTITKDTTNPLKFNLVFNSSVTEDFVIKVDCLDSEVTHTFKFS